MQSNDPASPLYWVEDVGKRLLKLADDSLAFGSLTSGDAVHMRHLRQDVESLLAPLSAQLQALSQINPGMGFPMALHVSKLLELALTIGCIAPASSESAKAAIAAGRARGAREAKAKMQRWVEVDKAILAVRPDDWKDRLPWRLAGHMKKKMDAILEPKQIKGIGQQAIYDRLTKALKEPM
jgi:hypothetical protein